MSSEGKAIYDYLKSKGVTNPTIAAILGNWSVESSINQNELQATIYPPVGATDSSWDDEDGSPVVQLYTMGVTQIFSNVV